MKFLQTLQVLFYKFAYSAATSTSPKSQSKYTVQDYIKTLYD